MIRKEFQLVIILVEKIRTSTAQESIVSLNAPGR